MQIIPVASGKGGVGKSLVAANLAIALGKAGKKVIIADLDLGASNLHLVLGQQAPKAGLGTYLSGGIDFSAIILDTNYENVQFIPGDAEIPGLTAMKISQKNDIIKKLQNLDTDFLIVDLGAGTHTSILDFFLLSPQGIIVTSPTVTATLDAYLFLKNAVFRLMYNSFKKNSKAYKFLESLKSDAHSLQRIYIPKLIDTLMQVDPQSTEVFRRRIARFKPRLILNMIDDPKDADKAQKIRRSCTEYLGLELEHLGIIYRDSLQDIALASRLPIVIYKPNAMLSQAIFRISEKIAFSETIRFDSDGNYDSFQYAESEAQEDFENKMTYIEELLGTGALTMNELAETIKTQQYEISQLKKENALLKTKIVKALSQGFTL
ncbi:MAG TPA: P-loop NTPase [Treponemataceae bacterium]|nr:P-loop NTPase [Treponemataceae bacterium]HQC27657.1 P-loop NTPase [Treponemataceae bacterium]